MGVSLRICESAMTAQVAVVVCLVLRNRRFLVGVKESGHRNWTWRLLCIRKRPVLYVGL